MTSVTSVPTDVGALSRGMIFIHPEQLQREWAKCEAPFLLFPLFRNHANPVLFLNCEIMKSVFAIRILPLLLSSKYSSAQMCITRRHRWFSYNGRPTMQQMQGDSTSSFKLPRYLHFLTDRFRWGVMFSEWSWMIGKCSCEMSWVLAGINDGDFVCIRGTRVVADFWSD